MECSHLLSKTENFHCISDFFSNKNHIHCYYKGMHKFSLVTEGNIGIQYK